MKQQLFVILVSSILFLAVVVRSGDEKADEDPLATCGAALEVLYDDVCNRTDGIGGGKALFEIRKECFKFPAKVEAHQEIVDLMNECNTEERVCLKKNMSSCGEEKFQKASEVYEKKAAEQKLAEKTLAEMFASSQDEIIKACKDSLACFEVKWKNYTSMAKP